MTQCFHNVVFDMLGLQVAGETALASNFIRRFELRLRGGCVTVNRECEATTVIGPYLLSMFLNGFEWSYRYSFYASLLGFPGVHDRLAGWSPGES